MTAPGDPGSRPPNLGRYELITRIGQGGMAEVQLALQRGPAGFEKLVVVKLVHENLATQKAFVDMLLDEARVAARAGLALQPDFTLRRYRENALSDSPAYLAGRERSCEGMRLAGVPEG